MANNKLCEENKGIDYAEPGSDFSIPNTIKCLKAIQREAKKATHALKELEQQQDDMNDLPVRAEGSA